jgi:branched-chain amino acid transport system permease protein
MLDILTAILIAGLTTGALYALATVGLSLVWGSMGMLNMAHAAMLTLGGYSAYTFSTALGLPAFVGFLGAIVVGAIAGGLLYILIVRNLLKNDKATFESNVMIATVGIGIALENTILLTYGGQPLKQPISATGSLVLGPVSLPYPEHADRLRRHRADGRHRAAARQDAHGPRHPRDGAEP